MADCRRRVGSLVSCLVGVMVDMMGGATCGRFACPPPVVFPGDVWFAGGCGCHLWSVALFFGCSIFGSCAWGFSLPLLPAVLQTDFCNISQFRQFLGVVGLV